MAITLPYPDLVFVPLDKLTAEEMNEIVANYTAIANDPGAVFKDGAFTGSEVITTAEEKAVRSIDVSAIPTGEKFFAGCNVQCWSTADLPFYSLKLRYNNTGPSIPSIRVKDNQWITFLYSFIKVSGQNSLDLTHTSSASSNISTVVASTYMFALKV